MKITDVLELLLKDHYYNCGGVTEIAKGKNEIVTNYTGLKRKTKRIWQYRK